MTIIKRILYTLGIFACSTLIGCGNKQIPSETVVITGTIVEKSCMYHTSNLVIQTSDGLKIPVYETYSSFSDGLDVGDNTRFEVEKVNGSGYRIVGIKLEQ